MNKKNFKKYICYSIEPNDIKKKNFAKLIEDFSDYHLPIIFEWNKDIKNKNILDKRWKFFDSSIWFYFIYGEDKTQREKHKEEIIKEIVFFYDNDVYDSAIAREFRDLQLQLVTVKPLKGGAHAGKIAPIYFHSEWEMKQKADELWKKIKNYKWDFLLIDDFANKGLRNFEKDKEFGKTDKQKLLRYIINGFSEENIINKLDTAEVLIKEYVKNKDNVKSAKDKIEGNKDQKEKGKTYDVLLLDYLFSNEEILEKNKVHYGIKLFEQIKDKEIKSNKGVKNRYWIFPVSVFNSSLISKMAEEGYEQNTIDWFFSPGADPINTPHLFRYRLYRFLELQINALPTSIKDVFSTVFIENKEDLYSIDDLQKWSKRVLNIFLEKYGFIFELFDKKDRQERENNQKEQNENELTAFMNSIYKKMIEEKDLPFSTYTIAEEIRNFLNYSYNQAFHRDLLFESFIKLNQYMIKIKELCFDKEKESSQIEAIENFFKDLTNIVITL